ncbi:MAG: ribulose-phosphate 3-epimerase, partial [Pseudomonadota bacterium]|nr:ribulose-phosphate 3-epimerase [Pseudomonadota bacterium]
GFGGQVFIPAMLDKIAALRSKIDATGRAIDLEVDGGVNRDTALAITAAGGDVLVAGSAVFGGDASAYAGNISRLRG